MDKKKIKIVAFGEAHKTGLGRAIKDILLYLHNTGNYEIIFVALGFDGIARYQDRNQFPFDLVPLHGDRWGKDILPNIILKENPDYVFTLLDWQRLNYLCFPDFNFDKEKQRELIKLLSPNSRLFKHVKYFPLDGLTLYDKPMLNVPETVSTAEVPVICAPFAYKSIREAGVKHLRMIPHAIDTNHFKPLPPDEVFKTIVFNKEIFGNKFVIAMIATNQIRKCFDDFLITFKEFARDKEDIYFFPITQVKGSLYPGAHNLQDLINRLELWENFIDPKGILECPHEFMPHLYNTFSCHTLLTIGEGFGFPPIEARACGIISLVSDNTACRDFAPEEWERIPARASFCSEGNNIVRYLTDTGEVLKKWEIIYKAWLHKKGKLNYPSEFNMINSIKERNLKWIKENLSFEVVLPQWDKLLRSEINRGLRINYFR